MICSETHSEPGQECEAILASGRKVGVWEGGDSGKSLCGCLEVHSGFRWVVIFDSSHSPHVDSVLWCFIFTFNKETPGVLKDQTETHSN